MNKKRNVAVSVAAAVLSGVLVYGIYALQLRQAESKDMVRVVVPKRFIAAGERIGATDLAYRSIAKSAVREDMVMEPGEADGWEAVVPLGAEEPLLKWKLDRFRLLPDQSQSTFQIPRSYVLSVSNGIRAGDLVVLYVSGEADSSTRLFGKPVKVASVKSAANTEVDDSDQSNLLSLANGDKEQMYASRRDANAMIDYINLNLTEEQWLQLDELCKRGERKLVIAFSPESLNAVDQALGEQP
ncbi:SAF domain-containing protein [Paenibacillus sp. MMS18-CY102]|uniref:SAF domain-containing protein n=1 Tax=Paenibacillus sp. MMS18-CY102 TaxID=2682849 RepID=UPI001365C3DB|nr:SAF domain-containing protein [Paenibacillus sp. MMS18-CY102]MWC30675.1 flagellar biosynthesis protein FlgA [Paenibacillus sp. MMS18-CY102]